MKDDMARLIELNEKLASQNDEIISLLRKLINDDEEVMEYDDDEFLFDLKLDAGEVLFVANSDDGQIDVYKLSVKDSDELKVSPAEIEEDIRSNIGDYNCEITIDNLTGSGMTSQYNIPLITANESLNRNVSIDSSIAILDDEAFNNLPDMLKIAMENGADKIHLAMKNAMAVVHAPPELMNHLEFYRSYEEIFDKLF